MNGWGDWLSTLFGGVRPSESFASTAQLGLSGLSEAAAPAADPTWWQSFGNVAKSVWEPVASGLTSFGQVAKAALPAAQLGLGVTGAISSARAAGELREQSKLARQSQRLQQETARQATAAAAPLTQFGGERLDLAAEGVLSPTVEAQIDLWKQGAKQKARDYLVRIGQGDSSTAVSWDNWIDQQAVAMRASALQDMERLGIAALTGGAGAIAGAGGAATQAARTAQEQMQSLEALIAQANQQLGQLAGGAA